MPRGRCGTECGDQNGVDEGLEIAVVDLESVESAKQDDSAGDFLERERIDARRQFPTIDRGLDDGLR